MAVVADLDVQVRPHLVVAWGILAAAAVLALARRLLGLDAEPADLLRVGLVGATLLAQGITYWYLPSFAKRAVVPAGAARAAPWLALAAALGAVVPIVMEEAESLFSSNGFVVAFVFVALVGVIALLLLLASFALVLAASPLVGPPWRGGVPFWRKEGPHRAGDRAALAAFASAILWLGFTAVWIGGRSVQPLDGPALPGWLLALGTLVLGSLAHLLPRARGAPLLWPLFLAAVLVLDAGGLLLTHTTLGWSYALVGLGAVLAALGLAIPLGARGKTPGPRLRDARPLLVAAFAIALASGPAFATFPTLGTPYMLGFGGLLAALLLGLAGLSLLTLPVVANQRPDRRLPQPAALAAGAGYLAMLAATQAPLLGLLPIPLFALATLLWLGALAPLRKPRRECSPDEA